MTDRFEETFEALLGSVKDKIQKVEQPAADEYALTGDTDSEAGIVEADTETAVMAAQIDTSMEGGVDLGIATEVQVERYIKLAKGAYLVPNYVSDYLMKNLSLGEQSVFNRLYRLSRGFHKKTEPITVRNLADSCGLNPKLTANIIKALASKRILKIIYSNPFTKKVKFKLVLPREVEQKMIVCGVCHNLIMDDEEWKYFPITVPVSGRAQAISAHVECVEGEAFLDGDGTPAA